MDDELRAVACQVARLERCDRRSAALDAAIADSAARLGALAADRVAEESDVEIAERGGLWFLLTSVFEGRHDRLARERAEAEAARLAWEEERDRHDALTAERAAIEEERRQLAHAPERLRVLRDAKRRALAEAGHPLADRLDALDRERMAADATIAEVVEALAACRRARTALAEVVELLREASRWATYDVFSSSNKADRRKRSLLDRARTASAHARMALWALERELADVGAALAVADDALAVGPYETFLDVWLNNPFSDWSVASRITRAVAGAESALARVDAHAERLAARRAELDQQQFAIDAERVAILGG